MKEKISLERMLLILAEEANIKKFNFESYSPKYIHKIGDEKENPEKSFWDLVYFGIDDVNNYSFEVKVEELKEGYISSLMNNYHTSSGKVVGLRSCIDIDKYLLLMDFECSNEEKNIRKVKRILKKLNQKRGFIVDSGNSFHYYGLPLYKRNEWYKAMNAFGGEKLVDELWVRIQVHRNDAILRLTPHEVEYHNKKIIKPTPIVVSEFGKAS